MMRALFSARHVATYVAIPRIVFTLFGLSVGSMLASCAAPPAPLAGADPADPNARVAAVGYRSTTAPYTRVRPVEPSLQRSPSAPSGQ